MDPATLSVVGGVVMTAAGVDIGALATLGVGSVIALLLIFGLVQAGLSVFYARSLNNQLSQGINAIVGVNNMTEVDRVMEDRRGSSGQSESEDSGNNGSN